MTLLAVSKIFKQGEKNLIAKDISFSIQKFQKIGLAGETGSGKSTLLKIIAGLVQPDAGSVVFEGVTVEGPEQKLVPGHAAIAYLSQHFELPRFLRVEQVLAYTNTLSEKQAQGIYKICRIDHLLKRNTDQLSGGEKQRIALARILISSPRLLLLDEPFSNLDIVHKHTLRSVIDDVCKKLKITCMLVSHDPGDVLSWADEVLVMQQGQIIQQGPPETLYWQPHNEYVAGLFGKYSTITAKQAKILSERVGERAKGRKVLVRPESFKLMKETKPALKGKVLQVFFLGSYCDIEVLISNNNIWVRTNRLDIKVGETVYVSFLPSQVWYL